jgi:hypothetical protein
MNPVLPPTTSMSPVRRIWFVLRTVTMRPFVVRNEYSGVRMMGPMRSSSDAKAISRAMS